MGSIGADTRDLDRLVSRIARTADPETRKALRTTMRQAGKLVRDDAAGRTDSKKVRATLRVSATASTATVSAGKPGVRLPALLEGDGTPGGWNAPNFPRRGTRGREAFKRGGHWMARRPYLHPALEAKRGDIADLLAGYGSDAARRIFKGT